MSTLSGAIDFFQRFGLFDVVLPFLLVFALVFALLEKTRILGVEEDKKTPKKNLNAIVAFVAAMLVIAVRSIVGVINEALPNVVLFLIVIISFLLLVGSFMKPDEGGFDFPEKHKVLYGIFVALILIGIILIFMGAIKTSDGSTSWLEWTYNYATGNWSGSVVGSVAMLIIVVGAIFWITYSKPATSGGRP